MLVHPCAHAPICTWVVSTRKRHALTVESHLRAEISLKVTPPRNTTSTTPPCSIRGQGHVEKRREVADMVGKRGRGQRL